MRLDYKITLADWKAAIRLHSRQKVGRRIHFFIYDFVIPGLAILAFGFIAFESWRGEEDLVDSLFMPVAVLIGLAILLPFVRNYQIRKLFKGAFPPSEMGPGYSLDIDEDRIVSTRPGIGVATYYWSGICGYAQDRKIKLLYLSDVLFLGIPLNKLLPDQQTELDAIIERRVVRKKS